jgi:hypothetical protein
MSDPAPDTRDVLTAFVFTGGLGAVIAIAAAFGPSSSSGASR